MLLNQQKEDQLKFEQIKSMEIFKNITKNEFLEMTKLPAFRERCYQKDETILLAGDTTQEIGLLLSGNAHIESNDLWGNKSILSDIIPGEIFAEVYAFLGTEPLRVDVVAKKESKVLFLHIGHLLQDSYLDQSWYVKLNHNLLALLAKKNLILSDRIFYTSSKSIRGRLLSYFSAQVMKKRSREFDIPFNRQQLADYLGVNRSALSHELGKMQEEQLIEFKRNHFVIKELDVYEMEEM